MILDSNWQLQQKLEYTRLKPECHSWWISKIQSWCEDTLEERYAIKFCFQIGKCHRNIWNASDCMNRASVFLSAIRDSRKAGSLWRTMRGVRGVSKSIDQSWLTKGLGLGLMLLCWDFKGVQVKIPSEEASTLKIGSVAFLQGQWTSPQLHPCHRLFDQDGHQYSSSLSLESRPSSLWLLLIPWEAVVMRQLRSWKRLWRRSLRN